MAHCSYLLTARQPVVHELKGLMSDAKLQWKEESDQIESKIDALLALERERLALEREKLEFNKLLLQQKKYKVIALHSFDN